MHIDPMDVVPAGLVRGVTTPFSTNSRRSAGVSSVGSVYFFTIFRKL